MIPATAFTILLALWCSRDDAQQIAQHSRIHHGLQWGLRAAVVVAVCYWWASWWLALGMAGLFSAVFRWDLNGRRGLDWRYIGPWSSIYDRVLYMLVVRVTHGIWIPVEFLGEESDLYHGCKDCQAASVAEVRRDIHRAGTMAYVFEAVVFVIVCVAYLWHP